MKLIDRNALATERFQGKADATVAWSHDSGTWGLLARDFKEKAK
jgi:hypothetical protein